MNLALIACGSGDIEGRSAPTDGAPPPSGAVAPTPWEMTVPNPEEWLLTVQGDVGSAEVALELLVRNMRSERVELGLAHPPVVFVVTDPEREPLWWSTWDTGIDDILRMNPFNADEAKVFTGTWDRTDTGGEPAPPGTYLAWAFLTASGDDAFRSDVAAPEPTEFTLG